MRFFRPVIQPGRRAQSGSILGISAIAMLAIFGAIALAIDISHMYLVAAELQNAADAAALAGASSLNGGSSGIETAVTRAVAAMNQYEFNKKAVGLVESNITFAANLTDFDNNLGKTKAQALNAAATMRFVKVTIPAKTISTVAAGAFMKIMSGGGTSPNFVVGRSAVAGQSVGINSICNYAPFTIIQDGITSLQGQGTGCNNLKVYTKNCVYNVKLNSATGNTVAAGDFVLLNVTSTRTNNDLRARLALGADGCISVNATLSFFKDTNGVAAGQVGQGINTRFGLYQSGQVTPTLYPPDLNVKENISYSDYKKGSASSGTFQSPQYTPAFPDRRVVLVPIINASSFNAVTGAVTVSSIGAFFIQSSVSNGNGKNSGLTLEYIGNDIVIGNGSYDPKGGASIAGLTVPVLYR